jgi:hypothetical protein
MPRLVRWSLRRPRAIEALDAEQPGRNSIGSVSPSIDGVNAASASRTVSNAVA